VNPPLIERPKRHHPGRASAGARPHPARWGGARESCCRHPRAEVTGADAIRTLLVIQAFTERGQPDLARAVGHAGERRESPGREGGDGDNHPRGCLEPGKRQIDRRRCNQVGAYDVGESDKRVTACLGHEPRGLPERPIPPTSEGHRPPPATRTNRGCAPNSAARSGDPEDLSLLRCHDVPRCVGSPRHAHHLNSVLIRHRRGCRGRAASTSMWPEPFEPVVSLSWP